MRNVKTCGIGVRTLWVYTMSEKKRDHVIPTEKGSLGAAFHPSAWVECVPVNESAMDEEEQQVLKLHSPNRVEQVSYKWPLLRNVSCIESGRLEIFSGCWMVLGHSRRSDRDYRHHQVVRAPCWAHWLRFEIDFMPTCWYFYDCAQMGV